ncbi:MAG: hypothetical protein KDC33_12205 [Thermoleophilia bacterium]|nr:hypothetical protein [Thermoleophilia bacterium]
MSDETPPGVPPDIPPPEPDGVVDAPGDTPPVAPACSECHSPLDPDQPYCLVCGAPTPRALPLRPRRGSAGLWIALALAALAIAAGALAWVLYHRDDDARAGTTGSTIATFPQTQTATVVTTPTTGGLPPDTTGIPPTIDTTAQVPTTDTTGTFTTVTGYTAPTDTGFTTPTAPYTDPYTDVTTDTTTELPPAQPVETDVASDWPAGTSAWTAIIASTTDAVSATNTRDGAQGRGYTAGILKSSEHTGLRGGYFVVYVGQYQSRAAVIRRVAQLKTYYPQAYPRYING